MATVVNKRDFCRRMCTAVPSAQQEVENRGGSDEGSKVCALAYLPTLCFCAKTQQKSERGNTLNLHVESFTKTVITILITLF